MLNFTKDESARLIMKVDLHCHSTCSDGTFSPEELIGMAKDNHIDVLALTDHDTVAGLTIAQDAANKHNIRLISGVEISCEHLIKGGYGKNKQQNKIIHVLGLGFTDIENMQDKLLALQQSRENRGRAIVEKLAGLFSNDDNDRQNLFEELWQAVLNKANNNPKAVGRAHIAQVMHDKKLVQTVQQAFDKYLADNKAAYVKIDALTIEQAISLIHQCGGKAVLAHPTRYNLSATRVRRLITDFGTMGGDACELPATSEPVSKRQMIDRAVQQAELKVSIGSDFHGTTMPWRKLGDVPKLTDNQQGIWHEL